MWNKKNMTYCAAVLTDLMWGMVCPAVAQEQENPYADYTVLVETFVVELTAEAVREAGADLLGQTKTCRAT